MFVILYLFVVTGKLEEAAAQSSEEAQSRADADGRCDDEPCSPVVSNSSLCSSSNAALPNGASRSSSPIEATPSRRKYKRGTSEELVEVVLKQMKKREAFEERVFEQLKATTDAVAKLGEGMLALAGALKKH